MKLEKRVRFRRRGPLEKFVVVFDIADDGGHIEFSKTKIIEARRAADAAVMFDFWARGETAQWGCKINARSLAVEIENFDDDEHPENQE